MEGNNQALLGVVDVDKKMFIHVFSTTEARETSGSELLPKRFLDNSPVMRNVRINSGSPVKRRCKIWESTYICQLSLYAPCLPEERVITSERCHARSPEQN